MPAYVFANNISTTLSAAITTTSQTTITLSSAANLPTLSAGQTLVITLNDAATQSVFEVLYCSAISGSTLTVARGQEGTAATTWLAGDYVYSAVTKGILAVLANTTTLAQFSAGLVVAGAATGAGGGVPVALNTTTAGYFQVGTAATALNLAMDYSSIQARNNGSAATLALNPLGGSVTIDGLSVPTVVRGTTSVSIASGQPGATINLSTAFGSAFTAVPRMSVTLSTTSGSSQGIPTASGTQIPQVQAYSLTTSGFFIVVNTPTGATANATATYYVDWTATQQ